MEKKTPEENNSELIGALLLSFLMIFIPVQVINHRFGLGSWLIVGIAILLMVLLGRSSK